MFEKQIEMIHKDLTVDPRHKGSQLEYDFNELRSVALAVIMLFKSDPKKVRLNITELNDLVETMLGRQDFNFVMKVVNFLTAKKTNFLNIHFGCYYKKDGEEEFFDMEPEQYYYLVSKKKEPKEMLTDEQFALWSSYESPQFGFYTTVIRESRVEDGITE